ncbi:MAG: endolytic transglycosylase MltG [Acidobacteria bacterium]|nr:endolytic transglycosylase MltG [Acidobacteriota bacterium]
MTPKTGSAVASWGRRLRLLALLVALLGAAGWLAWQHETQAPKLAAGAAPVKLVVPPGATADAIGRKLETQGLVRHPIVFRLLVRSRGLGGQLKAGEYALEGPLSLEDIVELLARGDVVRNEVTIPEGRTIEETAALAAAQGIDHDDFIEAARDPALIRDLDAEASDLEGYLFPDTYEVPLATDPAVSLVRRMVERFREVIAPERTRIEKKELTVRKVVILASLVELETAAAEERPRIAAVFLNRLARRMLLQTDPTIIYALKREGTWNGNIRRRDLEMDSPYNTYRYPGLPPGPIGSPGREAILAVLDPADTRDLYFVSRNDGTHHFSETLREHNRAVDRYQRRRRGR